MHSYRSATEGEKFDRPETARHCRLMEQTRLCGIGRSEGEVRLPRLATSAALARRLLRRKADSGGSQRGEPAEVVCERCVSVRVETVRARLPVICIADQDLWAFTKTLASGVAANVHRRLTAARTDVLDLFKALGKRQEHC